MPNNIPNGVFTGHYYAMAAAGGFIMNRGFDTVEFCPMTEISTYDVTNAVQITLDVRTFNYKLGIIKDVSNIFIYNTAYDENNDVFPSNTITFTGIELQDGLTDITQVISVGNLVNVYKDYIQYVSDYFGYPGGFASLFNEQSLTMMDTSFTATELLELITPIVMTASGGYIFDVSGSIIISDVTKMLRWVTDSDCMNNRNSTNTAADPDNSLNFGVGDGFIAGDLIFVPEGINLTLYVEIETASSRIYSGATGDFSFNYFSQTTTNSSQFIKRVVKAPLLIKLINAEPSSDGILAGVTTSVLSAGEVINVTADVIVVPDNSVFLSDVSAVEINGGADLMVSWTNNGNDYTIVYLVIAGGTIAETTAQLIGSTTYTFTTSYNPANSYFLVLNPYDVLGNLGISTIITDIGA